MRVWGAMVLAGTAVLMTGDTAAAQRRGDVELTPIVGYQWGGGGTVSRGQDFTQLSVEPSAAFGIAADFAVQRGAWVEAVVYTQPTQLTIDGPVAGETEQIDISNWYFQVGGLYEALNSGQTKPFAVVTMGATQMNPDTTSSEWFFSFSFGGGVKYYMTESVALRAQARGWVSVLSGSTGFYFGTGGVGATTWVGQTSTQGEVSVGLTFAL